MAENELRESDSVPTKLGASGAKGGLEFLKDVPRAMPLMISFKLRRKKVSRCRRFFVLCTPQS